MGAGLTRRFLIGLTGLAAGCAMVAGCGGGASQPPTRTVVVPRLAGLSLQAAVRRLCALGLRPGAEKVVSGPPVRLTGPHRTSGIVLVQVWIVGTAPAAAVRVPVGSTVTLRFGGPANLPVAISSRC